MAQARVVGTAFVVIRAITAGVDRDIKNGFSGVKDIGGEAGDRLGNSFRRGFQRSTSRNMFGRLVSESIAAKEQFSSLTRAGYVLAPALTGLAGIIGLLGTSIISLASTIGASLLPAMAVLGQAATALGQAMITVRLAFSGVAKAIQAGSKAAKSGAANTKALEKAQTRLERAERALAEAYEDANAKKVKSAEALKEAEDELAKARERAIEDLEQLGFESEDAAIAEQKAALELEKARESLARVSDLPPNSRARKEAELAFAQADLNYRRAIDRNNDLKKEEAKNAELAKLGPKALIDGQENVIEALEKVEDAKERVTDTEKENARAILAATEARDDAAEAVKELEDGGDAANAYADALSDLSKEAQAFVKYIVDTFIPALKDLKAAAGEKLFPKLEKALENLRKNLFPTLIPLLRETGGVLGEVAEKFSLTVTKGENLARLERIWKSNDKVLANLGDALNEVYEIILILLDTVRPLTEEFSKFVAVKLKAYKESLLLQESTGELAAKFEIARQTLKDLGTVFGNVFRGLNNLFWANVGPGSGGEVFLTYLKDVTKKFEELETIDGKPVKDFFANAAENGVKLLELLGAIFGGFIKLADNEGLGIFLGQLKEVVDIFFRIAENMDGAMVAFGGFLIEFAKFIELITEAGAIEIFFNTLKTVFMFLNDFLRSELGQRILELSAQILPLLAAFGLLAKVGGFFGRVVLGSILQLLTPIGFVVQAFGAVASAIGGLPLAIIAGLVAIFVGAYTQSEKLREAIGTLLGILKDVFIDTFNDVKNAISDAFPQDSIKSLKDTLKSVGDFLAVTLVPAFGLVASIITGTLGGAIKGVIYIIRGIVEAFQFVVNTIKGLLRLLRGDFDGAAQAFGAAFRNVFNIIANLFKSLVSVLAGPLNGVISAINSVFSKVKIKIPDWVPGFGGKEFTIPAIPRINFAEGGIAYPRPGGVVARIAEAGRPERVEPLDPDGLSERDKAIIDRLSGGPSKATVVNVTVNPSPGMDERELAAIVSRQIAFQLRRGAA